MMKDNNIIKFDVFKIERNRKKLCTCNPPQLTIDPVNRMCICDECGAVLDGFDGLMKLLEYKEAFDNVLERTIKSVNMWKEEVAKQKRFYFKNKCAKKIDEELKQGLLPYCPKCNEQFDPVDIKRYSRKLLDEE